jgi:5'-3' exonuclease
MCTNVPYSAIWIAGCNKLFFTSNVADTTVEESTEQDTYDPQTVRGRYYYEKLGFKGVEEANSGVPPHELVALCREYLRGLHWVMAYVVYSTIQYTSCRSRSRIRLQ